MSNCLIAEPLQDATHSEGDHGYGSLIGDGADDVALAGNVWAHNDDRNPRLKRGTRTVVANNLVSHYRDGCWMDPDTEASIEGNVFRRPVSDRANVFGDGDAFVDGNVLEPEDADTPMVGDGITQLDSHPCGRRDSRYWPRTRSPTTTSRTPARGRPTGPPTTTGSSSRFEPARVRTSTVRRRSAAIPTSRSPRTA